MSEKRREETKKRERVTEFYSILYGREKKKEKRKKKKEKSERE